MNSIHFKLPQRLQEQKTLETNKKPVLKVMPPSYDCCLAQSGEPHALSSPPALNPRPRDHRCLLWTQELYWETHLWPV